MWCAASSTRLPGTWCSSLTAQTLWTTSSCRRSVRWSSQIIPGIIRSDFNTRVDVFQVVVQMEPSEAYEVIHYIPAPSLPYSQPGSCYSLVRLPDDDPTAGVYFCFFLYTDCSSSSALTHLVSLQCRVRSVAPWNIWSETVTPTQESLMTTVTTTSMWYVPTTHQRTVKRMMFVSCHWVNTMFLSIPLSQLEDLEVTVADHIQKVLKPNFGAAWEEVGDDFEKEETFALASVRTLDGMFRTWIQPYGSSSAFAWCAPVLNRGRGEHHQLPGDAAVWAVRQSSWKQELARPLPRWCVSNDEPGCGFISGLFSFWRLSPLRCVPRRSRRTGSCSPGAGWWCHHANYSSQQRGDGHRCHSRICRLKSAALYQCSDTLFLI